MLICFKTWC